MKIKNIFKAKLLIAVLFAALLTGCEPSEPRIYTVTQYSASGKKIGQWENARVIKGRSGWCLLELPDGKQVMIDGPHMWEQQ